MPAGIRRRWPRAAPVPPACGWLPGCSDPLPPAAPRRIASLPCARRGPPPTPGGAAGCPHGPPGTVADCAARPDPALHWTWTLDRPPDSPPSVPPPEPLAENSGDAPWTADDRATITRRPPSPGRPTDSPRPMLNRLIVGVAEFSRRHALYVALGGLLLAVFS